MNRKICDKLKQSGEPAGRRCTFFLLLLLFATGAVQAVTPFAAYQSRIAQAAALAQPLTDENQSEPEKLRALTEIQKLLPPHEEVEFGAQTVRVDNAWLHAALSDKPAERAPQLTALAARLFVLNQRLSGKPGEAAPETPRALLEQILARPEYQPAERRNSAVQEWLKKIGSKLTEWLERLFATQPPTRALPGQRSLSVTRIVLALALGVALLLALFKLRRRLRPRARRKKKDEAREVLGEQLAAEITAADLLAKANELAQQGDYRTAIRRAYIALLYELEQRGKLRLQRAKTNRDYLQDLSNEPELFPAAVKLTGVFERVWYGHAPASASDFAGFIGNYREALSAQPLTRKT